MFRCNMFNVFKGALVIRCICKILPGNLACIFQAQSI